MDRRICFCGIRNIFSIGERRDVFKALRHLGAAVSAAVQPISLPALVPSENTYTVGNLTLQFDLQDSSYAVAQEYTSADHEARSITAHCRENRQAEQKSSAFGSRAGMRRSMKLKSTEYARKHPARQLKYSCPAGFALWQICGQSVLLRSIAVESITNRSTFFALRCSSPNVIPSRLP